MLILSREVGQAITIGEDVRVLVLAIKGSKVTLSIQAPHEIWLKAPESQQLPKHEGIANLVLQRGWQVQIGEDISCELVDARDDKVRLGIIAPQMISVHREEVYAAIMQASLTLPTLLPALDATPVDLKLSLWRAPSEGLVIGKDVTVLVLGIFDGEARLSVQTPDPSLVDIPEYRQWNLGKTIKAVLPPQSRHCIARDIFLHVQAVATGQVQLAIEAPDNVEILRKETWDRLHGT